MTKQVQRRRGTATQHTSFTGAEGEISVNTTNKSIHVHDGVTAGGIEGARADMTNVSDGDLNSRLAGNTLSSLTITSADINGGTIDGTVIGGATPAAGSFTTGSFTGNVSFGDNDKAIFGAGSDLQIYHSGSHSYIADTGAGSLYIRASDFVSIQAADGTNSIVADTDSEVTLYHNGSPKLATTATGIDVTGTVTADGLTVTGSDAASAASIGTVAQRVYITPSGTVINYNASGNSAGSHMFQTGNVSRLNIASNGDISFYEDTGTTPKFFWDASAESLGIGNLADSPVSDLTVGSGDAPTITIRNTRSDSNWDVEPVFGSLDWYTNDGSGAGTGVISSIQVVSPTATGSAAEMVFSIGTGSTNNEEAMRIDSSGNVGIGTSSPNGGRKLHVFDSGDVIVRLETTSAGGDGRLELVGDSAGVSQIRFGDEVAVNVGLLTYTHSENSMSFNTNGPEAMRIDSSGSLLVGKTATGINVEGFEATSAGYIAAVRDGGIAAYFQRKTSDGSIMEFRKDGSTVGSIGARSGDLYIASGDHGVRIRGATNEFIPTGAGGYTDSNGEVNLGGSGRAWKDLYLSGGVYLGGTGSANKLDDYEEGTWTPTMPGITTGLVSGYYTKVGSLVTAQFRISTSSITDADPAYISNLPFTVANAGDAGRSAGFLSYQNTGTWYGLLFGSSQNAAYFRSLNGSTATRTAISGSLLWGTLVYRTS